MAKKAACRCKASECEECPEWIFTFADLVMLMMGFFVILWVLKPSASKTVGGESTEDFNKVIGAIRQAFGYIPDPNSNDPVDIQMLMEKLNNLKINGPGEKGKTRIEPKGAEGTENEVTTIRMGKHATVGGRLLFDKGSATIPPEVHQPLDDIAQLIRGHRNVVVIKGHTSKDDFAESATAEQKMALSVKRSQAVADYLTQVGVEPDSLRVQGCSTFEPVIQRAYTPQAQANNRRVEVESVATLVNELQDNEAPKNPERQ